MKYVVGYAPGQGGVDAINVGVALSRSMGAELAIVFVVKAEDPYAGGPHARDYTARVEQKAKQWLEEAGALVPEDVGCSLHMHLSINAAAGLMEMAETLEAGAIIVGTSEAGSWTVRGLGSFDNALLHRATLPVILAPQGYENTTAISRISCAVSPHIDSIGLVEEAIATLNRTGQPVRLVCLLEADADRDEAIAVLEDMVERSSEQPREPNRLEIVVGQGPTVAQALESVTWTPDGVLMVGSSKLAQRGQLFLSSTAAKIVVELPLPVVMVPRDYHPERDGTGRDTWTGSIPVIDPDRS